MVLGMLAPIEPPQGDYGTEVVTVIVGTERKEFTIHSELLFTAVPVFRDYLEEGSSHRLPSALNAIRVEGGDWNSCDGCKKIVLPHEDPLLFSLFRDWIYSGRIPDNISRYMKAGHESYPDLFWWRVLQLGEKLRTGSLPGLAVGELEKLFSPEKPSIPSDHFIRSVFDEPSAKWNCMRQYIVRHVAFWVEKSADRNAWHRLLNIHKNVASGLASALMQKKTYHPQGTWGQSICSDLCYHGLMYEYEVDTAYSGIEESCYLSENRTFHLTHARLIDDNAFKVARSEADGNPAEPCVIDPDYESVCVDQSHWEPEESSSTERSVIATPTQSTIPEPPTEAAPPIPSQAAPSPIITSSISGQHVNTQHPQDFVNDVGGSNHADLVAKFSAWLLNEASGQTGIKGHDSQRTASNFKRAGNVAYLPPISNAANFNSHNEPTRTGAVNNGRASHSGLDAPNYCHCPYDNCPYDRCPYYGLDVVDPETPGTCIGCGREAHYTDKLALADGLGPRQQHNEAGETWGDSIDTDLGDWTNTGGNRKVRRTYGDAW
ncbi:hypothetical protein EDD37DRAFT_617738 [Exophiala viscosa]|uniref:uncharacterized protein n=1 Tax=Exophiala viscosa TaxID=2486360 RepID=UPI0021A23C7C|nr:hypothetical protein EDD37DRAFT_617738 [Exophiala viscosa]